MQLEFIFLDGETLTRQQIERIVQGNARVKLSDIAKENVLKSRERIEVQLKNGAVIYGVNTGFGQLATIRIHDEDNELLQLNLLRSDATGVGEPFPVEVVRTMMILRANALARGYSGIRLETLELLLALINQHVTPVVPSQGSVGASGDLAPLSHLALVLVGEGKAYYNGQLYPGVEALKLAGLSPVVLKAKEGLALVNGTQAMGALGVVTLNEVERIGVAADMAASLTMEALQGIICAFNPDLLAVRPHPEIQTVGARVRHF